MVDGGCRSFDGSYGSSSFRPRFENLKNTHSSSAHFKQPLLRASHKDDRSTVAGSYGSATFRPRLKNLKDTHLSLGHFKQPLLRKLDKGECKGGGRSKVGMVVRCTAEGIERGLFGGRGKEGGFVVPERIKVVALMACVMCLCNADRVVMSVAIVPLAAKHGWSSSFLGIVQVIFFLFLFSVLPF